MPGLQYFMPKQPSTNLSQPSVDMNATAVSTPVKLMQRFVNNHGWGDVDVTGMRDWRGNVLSNPSMAMSTANANVNADADKWAALSTLMNRLYYNTNSHNGGGPGGRGE